MNVKEAITKFHTNCKNIVISSEHFETGRNECHFLQQHFSIAFEQGWPVLKLKWYNYTSWKPFIKDTYVLT